MYAPFQNSAGIADKPISGIAETKRAIVVGAGFGGMAAALRLKAFGFGVTLIDRMPRLGGRAQVFTKDGFTYDAGPTVITAPFLFEELFSLFNEDMHAHVDLRPLDPWYRIVFSDGKSFDYGGSVSDTLKEIERFDPRDRKGYLRLLEMSRKIFNVGFTELSDKPFHRFVDMLAQVPRLIRLQSYRTVFGMVSRYIRNPYLRQIFSVHPLLVGGNPFDTTAIYTLIHYLERRWGVHYCMGGMGALVSAIGDLMRRQGIEIRLGTTVDRLSITNGRVNGVILENGGHEPADVVVMNADPPFVYRHMMPKDDVVNHIDRRIKRMSFSMGLFVLYFGTNRQYGNIAHHTIWMGPRFKRLLEDIFHRKLLADDFSLYLHRPTATDPSMAPEGCDSFYVLSPVPNLQGNTDWNSAGDAYRDRILDVLEQHLLPGLKSHLAHSFYMTPLDFKSDYLSLWGSGFSIAPVFRQSAWFRFHNKDPRIANLYFVGAGTHPGAGVPGVLSSAKVLQNIVNTDHPLLVGV
ncbi:MAG: phytoene desaturase family protein [Desulfobacterales bacterium]|nr:phytoene desaturase family protein [Desulfobacterales bacterium]